MKSFEDVIKQVISEAAKTKIKKIASGKGIDFWLIGNDVYRAPKNAQLDTAGMPMGKRWECDYNQWKRFREIFNWAKDVK